MKERKKEEVNEIDSEGGKKKERKNKKMKERKKEKRKERTKHLMK